MVEGLNAASRGRRQVVPDEDMPQLTGEAIDYFRALVRLLEIIVNHLPADTPIRQVIR